MPSVYSARCTVCGQPPRQLKRCVPLFPRDDEMSTKPNAYGILLADSGLALEDESKGFIAIPHPGEYSTLRRLVVDVSRAHAEGRILNRLTCVCTQCGIMTDDLHVANGNYGCTYSLAGSVALGLTIQWFWQLSWLVICIGGAVFFGALLWLIQKRHANHWQTKNEQLELKCCPECGGAIVPLFEVDALMPCPHCHETGVKYECFGIS
jgi:hypothetical protein